MRRCLQPHWSGLHVFLRSSEWGRHPGPGSRPAVASLHRAAGNPPETFLPLYTIRRPAKKPARPTSCKAHALCKNQNPGVPHPRDASAFVAKAGAASNATKAITDRVPRMLNRAPTIPQDCSQPDTWRADEHSRLDEKDEFHAYLARGRRLADERALVRRVQIRKAKL